MLSIIAKQKKLIMKKQNKMLLILLLIGNVINTNAQVKIGNNPGTINTNSLFEMESTNKGMLLPRVTLSSTTLAAPLTAHVAGMTIYNTATAGDVTPGWYYNDGTKWQRIAGTGWGLTGNSGLSDATNFIGTTDNIPFNIKVNNQRAGRIDGAKGNSFYGYRAGNSASTGYSNVAMGAGALFNNTIRTNLVAIGDSALYNNGLGDQFGNAGSGNTAVGSKALYNNTSAIFNTALGHNALYTNTTGNLNIALGPSALYSNTTGASNIATGYKALYTNSTGSFNAAYGYEALTAATTADYNNAFGYQSMYLTTTGNKNTASGHQTLFFNTTGNLNTADGYQSLYSNTTGSSNIGIGHQALNKNTTGNSNTATGDGALFYNLDGNLNTANGFAALFSNTSGTRNTAMGKEAMLTNSTGSYNTAAGSNALYFSTTGNDNTASGSDAMYYNTTGSGNTAFGSGALVNNNIGTNNTAVGFNTNPAAGDYNNSTAIGANTSATASNQVRIGSGVTSIGGPQGWTNTSDARVKRNISEDVKGLDFILKLRPVTYNLSQEAIDNITKSKQKKSPSFIVPNNDYSEFNAMRHTGFIAQEVETASNAVGFNFSGVDKPKNENDLYGLRYGEFVVPLVKAIQEQQTLILQQKILIEKLMQRIEALEKK